MRIIAKMDSNLTCEEWEAIAARGTSGDMVHEILQDWRMQEQEWDDALRVLTAKLKEHGIELKELFK